MGEKQTDNLVRFWISLKSCSSLKNALRNFLFLKNHPSMKNDLFLRNHLFLKNHLSSKNSLFLKYSWSKSVNKKQQQYKGHGSQGIWGNFVYRPRHDSNGLGVLGPRGEQGYPVVAQCSKVPGRVEVYLVCHLRVRETISKTSIKNMQSILIG